jgi:hypothetical protein
VPAALERLDVIQLLFRNLAVRLQFLGLSEDCLRLLQAI